MNLFIDCVLIIYMMIRYDANTLETLLITYETACVASCSSKVSIIRGIFFSGFFHEVERNLGVNLFNFKEISLKRIEKIAAQNRCNATLVAFFHGKIAIILN